MINFKHLLILITFLLLPSFGGVGGGLILHAQTYERLKGYYRVWQTTDSVLSYFWDGYMEIYIPVDSAEASGVDFCDRKFLGERRRKAPAANGDDTFIQMSLPNLEAQPLLNSISGDEYSTRSNGDIYLFRNKAGHISYTDSTTTVTVDELAGRPEHSLDMSQMKMYGIVATMIGYTDSETRYSTSNRLLSFGKRTGFIARYRGEDTDERISVTSEFFVTARQYVSKSELRQIKKEKNHIWQFSVPSDLPPLPDGVAEEWQRMVEY